MDGQAAILASLPPLLAIVVEVFNPISENLLKDQADRIIRSEQLVEQDPDVIAKTAHGATAVASLAPTILSVVSGGLAVASELTKTGFVLLALFLVALTALFLNLMKSISGLSFYQIGATTRRLNRAMRLLRRVFRRKLYGPLHTTVISRFIYSTNLLLLFMCLMVWVLSDDKSVFAGWLRVHLEELISRLSPWNA